MEVNVGPSIKQREKSCSFLKEKSQRKIFGPIQENSEWRILYNPEIYWKHGWTDIVGTIKASRIRWLGHLYRYSDAFRTKNVWALVWRMLFQDQKLMVLLPEEVGEKGFLESRSPTFRVDSSEKGIRRTGFKGLDWRQKA
ncbi:hypothetical protein TNCV_1431431 [Trichonephila clavipes]|nr:hypothetical protein TNCV_1431431 [Trichonephila clavipes]